ncbi:MAG: NAD(P)H-dependent oxidoreductase [Berryella intestinalis]|uniref:NAD(P)H-dependent oxidoreductase n=1 Tax=Berryella intestinalis TaxID=1531429 RepID=UPI002A544331|nr:NAD(P)H-dependent oxidoreductase [Berryella intestinalis]MDD7368917.1 NAD(P)H-dependent oxidoreductase [Berryella intestinalis]MDY3128455.1 NAD(P)H-dependent oxidoreductase [Berryella intestinalis]
MAEFTHEELRSLIDETFATRFTCKRYDPEGSISDEDFALLLDVARRSPSSFGLEPWKFLVIENEGLREDLLEVAWGAKKNADRTVIILSRKGASADSDFVERTLREVQGAEGEALSQRRDFLAAFQRNDLPMEGDDARLLEWAARQAYIVLGNMLTSAALLGIDSTPVEGFSVSKLTALLAKRGLIDPDEYAPTLIVQFGRKDASHFEPVQRRRKAQDVIQVVE